jgi:hypothetical protein
MIKTKELAIKEVAVNAGIKYVAIGIQLKHLSHYDQLRFSLYVWSQIMVFTYCMSGGRLGSVDLVDGLLQFTVQCENLENGITEFHSKMSAGEINFPEYSDGAPKFQYAEIGEGDPLRFMQGMMVSKS